MVISPLAWNILQRILLLLYEPYFTLGHAQCEEVLGVFLSLQYLRDLECRCEPDWHVRNAQIVPESLTQAGGLHAGGCVYSVPKKAITRHFVPHNSSHAGS